MENQLDGLLNCKCSMDDFYTANINYGTVSGDVHAGRFSLEHGSSLSAGNIGAATINKSVNNLDVKIGTRHIKR